MSEKFYKVVAQKQVGKFVSARISHWSSTTKYVVEYKVGEWTVPAIAGTKLYVFSELDRALNFAYDSEEIFEVEVQNPRKAEAICCAVCNVDSFWEEIKKGDEIIFATAPPDSTFEVDAIKLVKRIENRP